MEEFLTLAIQYENIKICYSYTFMLSLNVLSVNLMQYLLTHIINH